jgi:hypothetical protein
MRPPIVVVVDAVGIEAGRFLSDWRTRVPSAGALAEREERMFRFAVGGLYAWIEIHGKVEQSWEHWGEEIGRCVSSQ